MTQHDHSKVFDATVLTQQETTKVSKPPSIVVTVNDEIVDNKRNYIACGNYEMAKLWGGGGWHVVVIQFLLLR